MGRVFLVELQGRSYSCRYCHSPVALVDDVLSRSFNCSHGRAFLFKNAVNVSVGPTEERLMITGMHTVSDVFCCCCGQILGWKYVSACDEVQKYKEGKFVLERWRISEESSEDVNLDARLSLSDAENAQ
ncbi:protein yippee-like At5g53940 [Actinidia eriantha]|uniref:protein yippee-like At5g53940 n=1 Tax=Actinidia eriantha TaxID=165200 RepID=UPI0025844CFD|nr:protein yippee-like At5g53940 [Actinidia eriantha]